MNVKAEVLAMSNKILLASEVLGFADVTAQELAYLISVVDFQSDSVRNINNYSENMHLITESLCFLVQTQFFVIENGKFHPNINSRIYCASKAEKSMDYFEKISNVLESNRDMKEMFFETSQRYMDRLYSVGEGQK